MRRRGSIETSTVFPKDLLLTPELLDFFGAVRGAGSYIGGGDEGTKAQITVTKRYERPIMEALVKGIPVGTREALGNHCLKTFRKFPSGEKIKLPILYRPGDRDELRLYMRAGSFRPKTDMYWFVFEREAEPWLATLTQEELLLIHQHQPFDPQNGFDQSGEETYQESVNKGVPQKTSSVVTQYKRDAMVAAAALQNSGFRCEILPELPTFTSRTSGKPYLEVHHLIPMMEQRHFDASLDVAENVCVLNPYAHKMLHHATYGEIKAHLVTLAEPREGFFRGLGISIDHVLKSYGGP